MNKSRVLLALMLLANAGLAGAAPVVIMGTPENYCVTYCYIRIPFQVTGYDPNRRTGRLFCDLEAEVRAKLPVNAGVVKAKLVQASPIGLFTNKNGAAVGDVEMDTGIIKDYFVDAKIKSVHCHL
ncbi:MAG: hypothetical protein WA435_01560 [Gallionellaceae bacterium]